MILNKNKYEKLFDSFIELTEFTLVKYYDGWGLKDLQEGNLGDIESDRFEDALELIDRMDIYINDYLVRPIAENLGISQCGTTWGEMAKKYKGKAGESDFDVLILDALCNHPDEISLENCAHEVFCEKIYTVVCQTYDEGYSVISFHKQEDARNLAKLNADGVEKALKEQGYNPVRTESYLGVVISAAGRNIYYEWNIEESELY